MFKEESRSSNLGSGYFLTPTSFLVSSKYSYTGFLWTWASAQRAQSLPLAPALWVREETSKGKTTKNGLLPSTVSPKDTSVTSSYKEFENWKSWNHCNLGEWVGVRKWSIERQNTEQREVTCWLSTWLLLHTGALSPSHKDWLLQCFSEETGHPAMAQQPWFWTWYVNIQNYSLDYMKKSVQGGWVTFLESHI